MREIYADHAATTFPRPPAVAEAISAYLREIGCSPGRGGYRRALDAARLVYEARQALSELFHVPRAEQVIYTPSITYSLNLIMKGLLKKGDHVIVSSMEHNAVIRPLARLAREFAVEVEVLRCAADGSLDPGSVRDALRDTTRLVLLTHASNVTGTLLPVYEVGEILQGHGAFYAVDAAQTAGSHTLDFSALNCDYLAFTGHKGLLGPPGIGGICLSERAAALTEPLVEGGTGSRSEDVFQPEFLPDKFESGTQNVPGVAGLAAGVGYLHTAGPEQLGREKQKLTAAFLEGLAEIPAITVYGPKDPTKMAAAVSISVNGFDSGDLSFILAEAYGIMTRSGLHCSPLAHRTIGTFPAGTLRFSFGYGNTPDDIREILRALREIIKK